jgi:hypothetical protein
VKFLHAARGKDFDRSVAASIQYYPAAFITWLSTTSARGFDVAGTASRFEWRAAGHIKTSPAAVQLTTLEMAHRSGACQSIVLQYEKLRAPELTVSFAIVISP